MSSALSSHRKFKLYMTTLTIHKEMAVPKLFNTQHSEFKSLTEDEVKKIVLKSPNKYCELDPIPTNLLRECIDKWINSSQPTDKVTAQKQLFSRVQNDILMGLDKGKVVMLVLLVGYVGLA